MYAVAAIIIIAGQSISMSSPELRILEGGYYNLTFMVSLVLFTTMIVCFLQLLLSIGVDDSEDSSYVVTMCRIQIILVLLALSFTAFLFCYLTFPNDVTFSVGFETFLPYYKIGMEWTDIAYCCLNGIVTGFIISLLGDYYASSDCPPARAIIESSNIGIPFNTLKAKTYGNFAAVLIMALFSISVMSSVYLGAGIGLAYTGIFFLGYVSLGLVFFVAAGVCSNVR